MRKDRAEFVAVSSQSGGRSSGVQTVERAFGLLEIMAAHGGEMALTQLASASGLPMPTIHRLMQSLVTQGYVRQQPSRRYALGPRLIWLGESAERLLATWARPHLERLVAAIGETANLAMLDGDRAVYVAQVPSPHAMRMFTEVGHRVALHCTGVGKALLAQLPPERVRGILEAAGMPARTEHTIVDIEGMLIALEESRRQGYVLDDGEQEIGVRCYAVPVAGTPTLTAVSVSGPSMRMTDELRERAVPLLKQTAEKLAEDLTALQPI